MMACRYLSATLTAVLLLTLGACGYAYDNAELLKNIDYTLDYSSHLNISQLNGWIILEGALPSIDDRARAEEIARLYSPNLLNYITVSNSQQIKLDVIVLEVDREKVGDLGISWGTGGIVDGAPALIPGTFYIGQGITNAANPLSAGAQGYGSIQAKIKALTRQGHAAILAHPSVVTSDGSAAYINVGGSLPVPKGVGQNYAIDWKDYGIKLNVTPNVMQGGKFVNTDTSVEIVDIDPASLKNSVTISDGRQSASIPIFKKNNASANLSLAIGQTMALGGLLSYELNTDNEGLYGLSDLPVLGGLFKVKSQKHSAVDLVILITPTIVYSTASAAAQAVGSSDTAQKATANSLYNNRMDDRLTKNIEQ